LNRPLAGSPGASVPMPAAIAGRPLAVGFWAGHVDDLVETGRLGPTQAEAFGLLCLIYADCVELGEQLAREGWVTATDKGQAISPVARVLRDSRRDFVSLARDFGLTAASSARIPQEADHGQTEGDEEDAVLAKLSIRR